MSYTIKCTRLNIFAILFQVTTTYIFLSSWIFLGILSIDVRSDMMKKITFYYLNNWRKPWFFFVTKYVWTNWRWCHFCTFFINKTFENSLQYKEMWKQNEILKCWDRETFFSTSSNQSKDSKLIAYGWQEPTSIIDSLFS